MDRCRHFRVAAGFLPGSPEDSSLDRQGLRMISLGSDMGLPATDSDNFGEAAQLARPEVEE